VKGTLALFLVLCFLAAGQLRDVAPDLPALANTSTDATAALQAAIDAGQAVPPGTYQFSAPISVPLGKSLTGSGPTRTRLTYVGPPTDAGAVQIPAGAWAYSLRGFILFDPNKTKRGTGIRAGATDTGQFGTQSGFARIDDVWVDGFQYGLRFGDRALNTSSSEITATNLRVSECDVGVRIETPNSLDYTFLQFGAGDCRIGIESDMAGCVHVVGGSCTRVTESVLSITGAGVYSVRGLRTEESGYLLVQGMTLPRSSITLESCETNGNTRADKVDVLVKGGSEVHVRGGTYDGTFQYEGVLGEPPWGYGGIYLDGVACRQAYILSARGRSTGRWSIRNCRLLDAAGQVRRVLGDTSGQWMNEQRVPAK
jgi:hypothetical protein